VVNGRVPTEDVEGLVESVNATGLKIGGAWVTVSRFHPVSLPDAGAHVRLSIDAKGYIVVLENASPAPSSTDRDERITRLAVLKVAAEFAGLWGQTRPEIKSDHVPVIADKWLDWARDARHGV
jgi:hypothetical protein